MGPGQAGLMPVHPGMGRLAKVRPGCTGLGRSGSPCGGVPPLAGTPWPGSWPTMGSRGWQPRRARSNKLERGSWTFSPR
eukprot:1226465-Amphidinium_carterae.1